MLVTIKYFSEYCTIDDVDWDDIENVRDMDESFAMEMSAFMNGFKVLTNNINFSKDTHDKLYKMSIITINAIFGILNA